VQQYAAELRESGARFAEEWKEASYERARARPSTVFRQTSIASATACYFFTLEILRQQNNCSVRHNISRKIGGRLNPCSNHSIATGSFQTRNKQSRAFLFGALSAAHFVA